MDQLEEKKDSYEKLEERLQQSYDHADRVTLQVLALEDEIERLKKEIARLKKEKK